MREGIDFKIISTPFSWDDEMADTAIADFACIQRGLPYCMAQNIGMALAKLQLLEIQGCKVRE